MFPVNCKTFLLIFDKILAVALNAITKFDQTSNTAYWMTNQFCIESGEKTLEASAQADILTDQTIEYRIHGLYKFSVICEIKIIFPTNTNYKTSKVKSIATARLMEEQAAWKKNHPFVSNLML